MDFLEGFLMGSTWSDTEYDTRRHIGFYLLVGLLVTGVFTWLAFAPAGLVPGWTRWVSLAVLLTLMLSSPFMCRNYYRRPWIVRFLVLVILAVKQIAALVLLVTFTVPLVRGNLAGLGEKLMAMTNQSIDTMTGRFDALSHAAAMILGLLTGSLLTLLKVALVLLAIMLVPALFLLILRGIQRILDWIVRTRLMKGTEP